MAKNFKMEGLQELDKKLQKVAKNLGPGKIEPLLFSGAEIVAAAIKSKAPQGPTGNLKRSIIAKKMKASGDRIAPSIAAVDRRIAPHAGLVEFGSSRNTGKPYFRPGWDTSRGTVEKLIEEGIKKLVDEGAK